MNETQTDAIQAAKAAGWDVRPMPDEPGKWENTLHGVVQNDTLVSEDEAWLSAADCHEEDSIRRSWRP